MVFGHFCYPKTDSRHYWIPVALSILILPLVVLTLPSFFNTDVFIPHGNVLSYIWVIVLPHKSLLEHLALRGVWELFILVIEPLLVFLCPGQVETVWMRIPHRNGVVRELENSEIILSPVEPVHGFLWVFFWVIKVHEDHISGCLGRRHDPEAEPDVFKFLFRAFC